MSEQSIIALVAVIASFVIGLASLGLSFWNSREERKVRLQEQQTEIEERYRSMLYEKVISAHQQAFHWIMKLIEPVRRSYELAKPDGDLPDGFHTGITTLYQDARDWWDANCLYLDEASRARSIDFIEILGAFVEGQYTISQKDAYTAYTDALKAIQEGVGKKHLPKAEHAHR